MIIIGITGTISAGKGVVVEYLKNIGFEHFSMSGFIAEEVKRCGLPVNRNTLVAVGNKLRTKYGSGYIAEQLYEQARLTGKNCVIESIRTMGEVNALKSKGKLYLFAIDADPRLRYERIVSRHSAKDNVSFEQFLRDEQREMQSDDPNKQNLKACIEEACIRLSNDLTIKDLHRNIDSVLSEILLPTDQLPGRSLLNRDMILWHMERGNIFIQPFIGENIKTISYDVRLGSNFFQEQSFRSATRRILNPFDPDDIKRNWGTPQEAMLASDWVKSGGPLKNIRLEDRIIILGPGETILAHTEEFIGGRNCVTTHMSARSSIGRIGISVCKCAGWGDLGFCNRWTMEMSNHLKDTPVVLVVGMRVAQIAFYLVDPLKESYSTGGGQYQSTDDIEEIVRSWTPYSMLPKFFREKY